MNKIIIFSFFFFSAIHSFPTPPTSKSQEIQQQFGINYLKTYGYLNNDQDNAVFKQSDIQSALKEFQGFVGITITGELDGNTIKNMNTPRCSLPDTNSFPLQKRFVLFGTQWKDRDVTYEIHNYPTNTIELTDHNLIDHIIAESFKAWSDVANIRFSRVHKHADINIRFLKGSFTFPDNELANAYCPPVGDINFNDNYRWSNTIETDFSLKLVAIHEIGHSIGIKHSKKATSVLTPKYDSSRQNCQLHPDDVAAAVALYGKNESKVFPTSKTSTTTTPSTTTTATTTTTTLPHNNHPDNVSNPWWISFGEEWTGSWYE